ncbi:retinol dehydrogenase 12-like protein [Dermatophagoides farinae]|uniref:Retinol dehydrogenase 12-like protein n=1 Tax=Dermatophagoides farinae TaxID=6954 RepID=A0A9D4SFV0_DERFA|nr:retinol dehydrogenase 12-like protein [Dermatophagoides farinae]
MSDAVMRRIKIETLTTCLFIIEFFTNILRFVGLGRRYYKKDNRIDGKIVLITGANSGIGLEATYQLCRRGAKVVMCCRDVEKGRQAANNVRRRFRTADIDVHQLDLSSFTSIRRFGKTLGDHYDRIDILINNAGVMMCPERTLSSDGYEIQFATNHLEAYCQSKLANVLFTRQLAKELDDRSDKFPNVKVYSLNPGTINTNLTRHILGFKRIIFNIIGFLFNLDVYSGVQTTLFCALEPSLKYQSGHYYSNCKENHCIFSESLDDEAARRLWTISCQMVGIEPSKYFKI